jgi:hypothetical protein
MVPTGASCRDIGRIKPAPARRSALDESRQSQGAAALDHAGSASSAIAQAFTKMVQRYSRGILRRFKRCFNGVGRRIRNNRKGKLVKITQAFGASIFALR